MQHARCSTLSDNSTRLSSWKLYAVPQAGAQAGSSTLAAAAVDDLSRNERSIFGGEECDGGSLLLRQTAAMNRFLPLDVLLHLVLVARIVLGFLGILVRQHTRPYHLPGRNAVANLGPARRYGVHANAMTAVLETEHLGHSE